MDCNKIKTLGFDEKVKGWTSFFSYAPDFMVAMNNRFFSFKNGNLNIHNSETAPINNFYGNYFNSKLTTFINESPSEDKIFKTLVLEGNKSWFATLRTNFTDGTISDLEFKRKESRWFAYMRGSETEGSLLGLSTLGIGPITNVNSNTVISFGYLPDLMCVGDKVFQLISNVPQEVGEISTINKETKTVTLKNIVNNPVLNSLCFSKKNDRVEGPEIRGYFLEVALENSSTEKVELFAISSNVVKSYV